MIDLLVFTVVLLSLSRARAQSAEPGGHEPGVLSRCTVFPYDVQSIIAVDDELGYGVEDGDFEKGYFFRPVLENRDTTTGPKDFCLP